MPLIPAMSPHAMSAGMSGMKIAEIVRMRAWCGRRTGHGRMP